MYHISVLITICLLFTSLNADPFEQNQKLARGINMGNMMEAPSEGAWGVSLDVQYFPLIVQKGFQSVRVPIRWGTPQRMSMSEPYTITPSFFDRVDSIITAALDAGLMIVINDHHDDSLFENSTAHWERFVAMWKQISYRYRDYSDNLIFEILNEPHGDLDAASWNVLLKQVLDTIRIDNPQRTVIIGTADWGGIGGLMSLELPQDSNLILTVHYYNPFQFTHQGAEWVEGADIWLGTTWSGNYFEKLAVVNDLEYVRYYSQEHNIPIYIGEFGAYSKADNLSRAMWSSYCSRLFEKYDFSWSYWEFSAGFGIYNPQNGQFRDSLVNALISSDTAILEMNVSSLEGTDLLINGDFATADNWTLGPWGGEATDEIVGGEMKISFTDPGTAGWHIQFMQTGIELKKDSKYALIFEAHADSARIIGAGVELSDDPWSSFGSIGSAFLTEKTTTFATTFTMLTDVLDARVCFNVGGNSSAVYIDNVRLINISDPLNSTFVGRLNRNGNSAKLLRSAGGSLFLDYHAGNPGPVAITLYNLMGKIIWKKTINADEGTNKISLPAQFTGYQTIIGTIKKGNKVEHSRFVDY